MRYNIAIVTIALCIAVHCVPNGDGDESPANFFVKDAVLAQEAGQQDPHGDFDMRMANLQKVQPLHNSATDLEETEFHWSLKHGLQKRNKTNRKREKKKKEKKRRKKENRALLPKKSLSAPGWHVKVPTTGTDFEDEHIWGKSHGQDEELLSSWQKDAEKSDNQKPSRSGKRTLPHRTPSSSTKNLLSRVRKTEEKDKRTLAQAERAKKKLKELSSAKSYVDWVKQKNALKAWKAKKAMKDLDSLHHLLKAARKENAWVPSVTKTVKSKVPHKAKTNVPKTRKVARRKKSKNDGKNRNAAKKKAALLEAKGKKLLLKTKNARKTRTQKRPHSLEKPKEATAPPKATKKPKALEKLKAPKKPKAAQQIEARKKLKAPEVRGKKGATTPTATKKSELLAW